jgi:exodeoxyribonuclease III
MDAFVVRGKRSAEEGWETSEAARHSPSGAATAAGSSAGSSTPLQVIIAWNANGATPRAKDDDKIAEFLAEHKPDVLCVQEVRLRADSANQRSTPALLKGEVASKLFGAHYLNVYHRYLSLADSKKSGTMTLVRKGIEHTVCSSLHAALKLIDAGSDVLAGFTREAHHPEGRVQYIKFRDFDCLHTYVPNSGATAESISRRERWDADINRFLLARAELPEQRPLVWAGDLNVAHTEHDSTDEAFFRDQRQPGFLEGERDRFSSLLETGGLVDVWRQKHPVGPSPPPRESAAFTWRGDMRAEGKTQPAKYEGKAMRIDYFCVTADFAAERVESCEILGHGIRRVGFLGSDHAPIKLTLKPSPP